MTNQESMDVDNFDALAALAESAKQWGKEQQPYASPAKHAAFANCVVYARFRVTGPCGGPSLREHIANAALNSALIDWREASLQEICIFLFSRIYGALTEEHLRFWLAHQELCSCDDADDLATLRKYAERNKFDSVRIWRSTLNTVRQIAATSGGDSIAATLNRIVVDEAARLQQKRGAETP